jgi:hypothetical protein
MISSRDGLTDAYLRTPRAAAFAGIIFSLLLFVVFGLMRLSVPSDPLEQGAWLAEDTTYVTLAMNLVSSGVAFLWFVGVLRESVECHHSRSAAAAPLSGDRCRCARARSNSNLITGRNLTQSRHGAAWLKAPRGSDYCGVPLVFVAVTTIPGLLQRPTFCVSSKCGPNAQRSATLPKLG